MSTEAAEVVQPTENIADATKTPEVVNQEPGQESGQEPAQAKPEKTEAERIAERMERRIGRKTAEAYEARARADAAERRIAELEAKYGQSGGVKTNEVDIQSVITNRAQEIVQAREVQTKSNDIVRIGKSFEGFEDAVAELATELPLFDEGSRPTAFMSALLDADVDTKEAAKILHYLGKNPEEASEFVGLTPTQIGRRIERLQTKLSSESKTQTSNAPVPIKPAGNGGFVEKDPSKMSDAEWYKWSSTQKRKTP